MKGEGNQLDFGARVYDPRIGRFLSVDPFIYTFPYYSSYLSAGNNPIKLIDLDGGGPIDPQVERLYKFTPYIDMRAAPGKATNAAGFPRDSRWFWREMLKQHPEMFDAANVAEIKAGRAPVANNQWLIYNSEHSAYIDDLLVHHHIEQGPNAAGIPKKSHLEFFKELHPDLPGPKSKGAKLKSGAGTALSIFSNVGDIISYIQGNPESILAQSPCIGCDPSNYIGKVLKEPESGAYYTITNVNSKFVDGKLQTKTITYDIYARFEWDDKQNKYVGTDKITSKTETWFYDKDGKRSVPKGPVI